MALKLGKTVADIRQMSAIEFTRWRMYFPLVEEIKADQRNEDAIARAVKKRNE